MRIIIAGGRDFNDYNTLEYNVASIINYIRAEGYNTDNLEIVSGDALGADTLAKDLADKYKFKFKMFRAYWDDLEAPVCYILNNDVGPYNSMAGLTRNQKMADYAEDDKEIGILIAFWNGKTFGTKDMIYKAKTAGLKVYVIEY